MFYRALLLFLIATVCSLVPTEANYNVYTAQNGMDCIVCSKGYFWIKDCIKNMTIAICQPCPSGTYNNKSGIPHYCSPCTTECRDSNSYIKESCTTVTDINCECRYGYYKEFKVKGDKETWYCKPHSSCPPGRGVAKNGTPHEDTICKPCSSGTYSNFSSSLDPCTQCSKCNGSIESVIHECSGTSDTVCRINDEGQKDSGSFVVQHILMIVLPVILLLVVVSCVIGCIFYYDYRNDKWCFKKEKDDQVHKDAIVSFVSPASMSPNEAQNQNYINLATENYPESCRYALETDGHDTRFNQEEAAEQPTWDRFFNELCSKIIPDWETIVRDLYGEGGNFKIDEAKANFP
uniref:NGFR protein n=1 Tax=Tegillarca granosa TaxID=220873 RepID=A0A1L1ZLS4_TEGGR|nr:NGFR protein [Tegillarca granosa]